jgi:hypothetical protein
MTIQQQVNLNATGLTTLNAGNYTFNGNSITLAPNNNAMLLPTGTGVLNLTSDGLTVKIIGNTWTPDPSTDVFQFNDTGIGYWDMSRAAPAFPVGTTSQRPANPEVGMIRYNTSANYEEVWNGTAWQPAIGPNGAITQTQVDDIMTIWSLILG